MAVPKILDAPSDNELRLRTAEQTRANMRVAGDDWDESKHPRAKDGKFGGGEGDESAATDARKGNTKIAGPREVNVKELSAMVGNVDIKHPISGGYDKLVDAVVISEGPYAGSIDVTTDQGKFKIGPNADISVRPVGSGPYWIDQQADEQASDAVDKISRSSDSTWRKKSGSYSGKANTLSTKADKSGSTADHGDAFIAHKVAHEVHNALSETSSYNTRAHHLTKANEHYASMKYHRSKAST